MSSPFARSSAASSSTAGAGFDLAAAADGRTQLPVVERQPLGVDDLHPVPLEQVFHWPERPVGHVFVVHGIEGPLLQQVHQVVRFDDETAARLEHDLHSVGEPLQLLYMREGIGDRDRRGLPYDPRSAGQSPA